jgi:hypothetical protein
LFRLIWAVLFLMVITLSTLALDIAIGRNLIGPVLEIHVKQKNRLRGFCIENRLSTCVETQMNKLRQW